MNMAREQLVTICASHKDAETRRKAAAALYLAGWVDGRQASENDAAVSTGRATASKPRPAPVSLAEWGAGPLPSGPLPSGPLEPDLDAMENDPRN